MNVRELSREQLIELKQGYLTQKGNPSYGELAAADELVPDETIFEEYSATEFTPDDFVCAADIPWWEKP